MKKAKDTRTQAQKDSLIKLMHELIYKYNKDMTIHGHNEYANKSCPCFITYKKNMRIYSLICVLTLFSCSANYHYRKALKKGLEPLISSDTIRIATIDSNTCS